MPDPRFFPAPDAADLADLAAEFGLELVGEGGSVSGVAPLDIADGGDLSFLANRKHLAAAKSSKAAAFVVSADLVEDMAGAVLLISQAPQRDYARIARKLYPVRSASAGVHPNATIAPSAEVGEGCEIGPGAAIGDGVVLGKECSIGPNVSISHSILGDRVRVLAGAAIGQDGFGYAPGEAGLEPIPQLGRVVIGDDVDIGANTTIDRGAGGDTSIGAGTKIDNQVQIGHNCKIGSHCVIVSQAGISGSVTIGNFVQIGGKVGVADHVTIGDGVKVAAGSGVIKDIGPGETQGGYPAQPVRSWHRQTLALARLGKPKREK